MRRTAAFFLLALATAAGCSSPPTTDVAGEREALMEADRAWGEVYAASDDPAEAFVAGMEDGATLLPPGAPLAQGKDAIREVIAQLESMPGFSVTWSPEAADVGSGGDLGYTRGSYRMTMDGPDGPMSIDGKYLTIWKKQPDGTWKVTADMFNADAPAGSAM